jgi:hypothetical protein
MGDPRLAEFRRPALRPALPAPAVRPAHIAARALGLGLVARALGLGVAALAFAVGSAAASSQPPTGSTTITQAVGSKTATVSTAVHDWNHVTTTSVPVGVRVHASVAVTGNNGMPTGSVTITFYASSDCTPGDQASYGVDLTAWGTFDSLNINTVSKVATTMSVQVKYNGDATYAAALGPCRSITFTKLTPTIKLEALDWNGDVATSVPFNQSVSARATVAGTLDVPTGLVLVRGWANADCSGSIYDYTTKNLDASGVADDVLTEHFASASIRSYKAHYAGNGTYSGIWSDCISIEGTKIGAGVKYVLHDQDHAVAGLVTVLGGSVHVATGTNVAAGLPQPGGTFTIHVYTGKDCQVQAYQQSVAAAASVDDGTFGKAFPGSPGYISWKLAYSGDANYIAWTSVCSNLQFLAPAHIAFEVHDASHNPVTSITLGESVHLSATVTGDFGPVTGQVGLEADETGACKDGSAFATPTLTGGVSDDASLTFKAHAVETVWFSVTVPGDGTTYAWTTSACVPVQVLAAPATPAPKSTPAPTAQATPAASAAVGPTAPASADPSAPTATGIPDAPSSAEPTAGDATDGNGSTSTPATPGATAAPAAGGPVTPDSGSNGGGMLFLGLVFILALGVGFAVWFAASTRRGRRPAGGQAGKPATAARPS